MTELAFHPKYVAPFYMDLMNLNFLRKSNEEIDSLFNSIKSIAEDLSDDKLIEMLNDSWRPSKVSAWIIGISNRQHLTIEIESFLSKKGIQYSEHGLINLFILKGAECNKFLKGFIKQQINYLSETSNKLIVENLSIEWAISILNYVDKNLNSTNLNEVYNSEEWMEFENELKKLPIYDAIKPIYEPTYYAKEITALINKIRRG